MTTWLRFSFVETCAVREHFAAPGGEMRIRCCLKKVSSHRKKDRCFPAMHREDRTNDIVPDFPGRRKRELSIDRLMIGLRHFLENPHSPVSLDIAVPPDPTESGSLAAHCTEQQVKNHNLANRSDRVAMLGQPHRPARDDASFAA